MKNRILFIFILTIISCNSTREPLNGKYGKINKESNYWFSFEKKDSGFEYFLKGEWGILQYSKGKWSKNGKYLYLMGYTDKNLKLLDVNYQTQPAEKTQLDINCNTINAPIFTDIIINDTIIYRIKKDTVLMPKFNVKVIQVKSYLVFDGMLPIKPLIDTLVSVRKEIDNSSDKQISLNYFVKPEDFVRVVLSDTLLMNNKKIYVTSDTKKDLRKLNKLE